MIKFFRKIRYDLMEKNKTGKYLKYAIGEIVLVVIGILIALQINNWNESRKLESSELNILVEIKENLISSKKELIKVMDYNKNTIRLNKKIYYALTKDLPYEKSLDTAFSNLRYWQSPYLTFTAYETIKNKGIDIIKNDKIKKSIIHIYESQFTYLVNDYDRSEWVLAQSVVYPQYVKHIRRKNKIIAVPNDYEALKKNDEFINMVHEIIILREDGILDVTKSLELTQNLIGEIDNEINSRK